MQKRSYAKPEVQPKYTLVEKHAYARLEVLYHFVAKVTGEKKINHISTGLENLVTENSTRAKQIRASKKHIAKTQKTVSTVEKRNKKLGRQVRSLNGKLTYIQGVLETNESFIADLAERLENSEKYSGQVISTLQQIAKEAGYTGKINYATFTSTETLSSALYSIADKNAIKDATRDKNQYNAMLDLVRTTLQKFPEAVTDVNDIPNADISQLSLGLMNVATNAVIVAEREERTTKEVMFLGQRAAVYKGQPAPKNYLQALTLIGKSIGKGKHVKADLAFSQYIFDYLTSADIVVPVARPTDQHSMHAFYQSEASTLVSALQTVDTIESQNAAQREQLRISAVKSERDEVTIDGLVGVIHEQGEEKKDLEYEKKELLKFIPPARTVKNTNLDVIKAAYDTFTGPHTHGNTTRMAKKTVEAMKYAPQLTAATVSSVITSLETYFGKDCVVLETIAEKLCEAARHYRPAFLTFNHAKAMKNIVLEKLNIA